MATRNTRLESGRNFLWFFRHLLNVVLRFVFSVDKFGWLFSIYIPRLKLTWRWRHSGIYGYFATRCHRLMYRFPAFSNFLIYAEKRVHDSRLILYDFKLKKMCLVTSWFNCIQRKFVTEFTLICCLFFVVLADANFPTSSICREGPKEVRADGHSIPALLEAILQLMPLDTYCWSPVTTCLNICVLIAMKFCCWIAGQCDGRYGHGPFQRPVGSFRLGGLQAPAERIWKARHSAADDGTFRFLRTSSQGVRHRPHGWNGPLRQLDPQDGRHSGTAEIRLMIRIFFWWATKLERNNLHVINSFNWW